MGHSGPLLSLLRNPQSTWRIVIDMHSQYVCEYAETPHVSRVRYRCEGENFGRAVFDSIEENTNGAVWIDALSNAELGYFHVERLGRHTKYIFGLCRQTKPKHNYYRKYSGT